MEKLTSLRLCVRNKMTRWSQAKCALDAGARPRRTL